MDSLINKLMKATIDFWNIRNSARTKQKSSAKAQHGERAAVISGKHLDPFIELIKSECLALSPEIIFYEGRKATLPCINKLSKNWDLVVELNGKILAVIELKSMAGKSFGNNIKERNTEAFGNFFDIRQTIKSGMINGEPILCYFMVMEDCEKSRQPVKVPKMICASNHNEAISYFDRMLHNTKQLATQLEINTCVLGVTQERLTYTDDALMFFNKLKEKISLSR